MKYVMLAIVLVACMSCSPKPQPIVVQPSVPAIVAPERIDRTLPSDRRGREYRSLQQDLDANRRVLDRLPINPGDASGAPW